MNELRKSSVQLNVFRGCEFIQAITRAERKRSDYRESGAPARRFTGIILFFGKGVWGESLVPDKGLYQHN